MAQIETPEFNPFDFEFHRNPYPTYEWLREEAPVYHNPTLDFWALSRFDDVLAGLHDPATYTSGHGVALEDEGPDGPAGSMIHLDPPDHTAMRKLVSRRFTPRRIAELEPRVREWTRSLVAGLDGRRDFDVVTDYAALLPATVISTMLGIPVEEHEHVRVWTDQLLTRDAGMMTIPHDAGAAMMKLVGLSAQLMTLRRERPTDDILSLLVEVELDGEKLTDAQVIGFCILLISGGHETTAKLIANGVRLFASHPEQRDAVIADPAMMVPAVEELLRFTSPTQYMTRTTTRDGRAARGDDPRGEEGGTPARVGQPRPERVRPARRVRHPPRQPAHPGLRPRRARVPGRHGREARGARRAAGVPRAVSRVRGRRVGIEYLHSGNVQGPTRVPVTVR